MPWAIPENSPALSISLAEPSNHIYLAGDTIIGKVIRQQHVIAPQGQVTIKLLGRTKTKIEVPRSDTTSHDAYRSRYNFFGYHAKETSQVLYSGPLHVAADEEDPLVLPFAVTIPTHPSVALSREAEPNSFIPTDADSLTTQQLPPSFSVTHSLDQGYVEYWLEARISPGPSTSNKAVVAAQSTHPIALGVTPTLEQVPRVCTMRSLRHSVASYKLIPSMENSQLTFKQKSKQFFNVSSVPSLAYSVQTGLPDSMQFQQPRTIPLTLRISPVDDGTTDDVRKTAQKATINSISLHLKQHTRIRAGEHFLGGARESVMTDTIDLCLDKALGMLPEPVVVDIERNGQLVDLGVLLELRLTNFGLESSNQRLASRWQRLSIMPDFETYNLRVWHSLKAVVSITVGGKEHEDTFKADCRILAPPAVPLPAGPSRAQAGAPPPSFSEAVGETMDGDQPPNYEAGEKDPTQLQGKS